MGEAINCTTRRYVCASERIKLISTVEGRFPDFGHHVENEMGGLWLHPIKLMDGFWMHLTDRTAGTRCWLAADSYTAHPYGHELGYDYGLGGSPLRIRCFQLAPEEAKGMILHYTVTNPGAPRDIHLDFLARCDLRPVWFSEATGVTDGEADHIAYDEGRGIFHAKDCDHQWHVLFGASQRPVEAVSGEIYGPEITQGGVGGKLRFSLHLEEGESKDLHLYIAGSEESYEDCLEQYHILSSGQDFLASKQARMEKVELRSRLTAPDPHFTKVFSWIKANTDWLILDTAYGRGLSGGIPEYVWWFGCDSCYSVQGLVRMGDFELARDTLELVLSTSERVNGNGRIIHEVTTNGAVYNPGNTQETAQFVAAVWEYFQWTGDRAFLDRAFPYLELGVRWLQEQDGDGDLFPSGYAMIEIAGLDMEMIDTAAYTCEAYRAFSQMCLLTGREEEAARYRDLHARLRDAINGRLWDEEEGLYCDAYTGYATVVERRDAILEQARPEQREELAAFLDRLLLEKKEVQGESGWLLNRNWVILTPMEMGIAPRDKADRALARMHTGEFIGPYGMYLSALHPNETMTISTGAMAVAQCRYRYADRALELLQRMFRTFGMATPGSLSEMSPDHGCFVQAWTVYSALVPVVSGFFGIRPDAAAGEITLSPCLPDSWPEARLDQVRTLDGWLSLGVKRDGAKQIWTVENNTSFPLRWRGEELIPPGNCVREL